MLTGLKPTFCSVVIIPRSVLGYFDLTVLDHRITSFYMLTSLAVRAKFCNTAFSLPCFLVLTIPVHLGKCVHSTTAGRYLGPRMAHRLSPSY